MDASEDRRPPAVKESLAIPDDVRAFCDERDGKFCRVCGKFLGDERALHHIIFGGSERGMGGRRVHEPTEIITVCWMWGGNCHDRVHGDKSKYQQILLDLAAGKYSGGTTALQVLRWQERERVRSERAFRRRK